MSCVTQKHAVLMIFVIAIPKESLPGLITSKHSLGMTMTKISRPVFVQLSSYKTEKSKYIILFQFWNDLEGNPLR